MIRALLIGLVKGYRLLLSPWNEDERETPALKAPSHGCDHELVALCWSR